jgi:hypothetical protein
MARKLKNLVLEKMDILIDNSTLVEQIANLSSLNQIIETIIVDDNDGSIKINKTIKDSNSIKNIDEEISYNLKSTRLIIKTDDELVNNIVISDIDRETIVKNRPICECISKNTNNIVSREFRKLSNVQHYKINFFNQSFFKKLFNPINHKEVFEKIKELAKNNSWMIIPPTLMDLFENESTFQKIEAECESIIHQFGHLENVNVFMNPDQKENCIYFGSYESLTLIVNKNLTTKEIKTNSTTYTKGLSMEVNYLLIENKPITVLEFQ